jgi:hypothetical protein
VFHVNLHFSDLVGKQRRGTCVLGLSLGLVKAVGYNFPCHCDGLRNSRMDFLS